MAAALQSSLFFYSEVPEDEEFEAWKKSWEEVRKEEDIDGPCI